MITQRMMRLLAIGLFSMGLVAAPAAAERPAFDQQRLFTTAEQRAQLNEMRARIDPDADEDELLSAIGVASDQPEPEPEVMPEVGVRGFVSRSGGPPALWFDDGSGLDSGERGRIEGREVVITLPDGRTIRLKPGQVYDPERGEVVDRFRR